MNVIIFLLITSLTAAICFLVAYIWSVRSGQFDDNYSPAQRILFDDMALSVPLVTATTDKTDITTNTEINNNLPKHQIIQNENQK